MTKDKLSKALLRPPAVQNLANFTWHEIRPSDYGSSRPGAHVHEIAYVQFGPNFFFAKAEKACLKLPSSRTQDYASFRTFVDSLFESLEGSSPSRTFSFDDDPEVPVFTVKLADFQGQDLSQIQDETDPATIDVPAVRAAFILYLGRKESLEGSEKSFINVFNHHGRDLICEYLASITGRLLGVRIPRVFLATHKQEGQETRYILSRSLGQRAAQLGAEISRLLARKSDPDLARQVRASQGWPNPFGLRAREGSWPREITELLFTDFPYHEDLIRSDVLDILFFCDTDRKLEEFLLPRGQRGPIFTIDYGEAFYPELQFFPDDHHLQGRLAEHKERLRELLFLLKAPAEGLAYACYAHVARNVLQSFAALKLDFFQRLLAGLPERFFHYEAESPRLSLRGETLTFVLGELQQMCREHL